MDWPIGPYGTSMGALLLFTLPIHFFLTRDEKERRVSLVDLPKEIKEKGSDRRAEAKLLDAIGAVFFIVVHLDMYVCIHIL